MIDDPKGDVFGQQSVRIFVSTLKKIIDEQYRVRSETGGRATYAELVEQAWDSYEREQNAKSGAAVTAWDPKLEPLVMAFLELYFSKPTGKKEDRERDQLIGVLRLLFPEAAFIKKSNDRGERKRA